MTRVLYLRRRRTLLHGRAPWFDLRGSRVLGPLSDSGGAAASAASGDEDGADDDAASGARRKNGANGAPAADDAASGARSKHGANDGATAACGLTAAQNESARAAGARAPRHSDENIQTGASNEFAVVKKMASWQLDKTQKHVTGDSLGHYYAV